MNVQQTHQEHLLEARPEELYVSQLAAQVVLQVVVELEALVPMVLWPAVLEQDAEKKIFQLFLKKLHPQWISL